MFNAARVINSMLLTGFGFFCYTGYIVGKNFDTKFLTEKDCKYHVFSSKFMRDKSVRLEKDKDKDLS
jgi:hypothetical protein